MYNLLIVDDEIYAVEGLKSGVRWAALGFTGLYEAYNVADAKNVLQTTDIDLVICDIEMPEGDGFELIEWIRAHHPELDTLFLTCHAEFHYAQRAIQLGAQDYLLKPVDFAALESVVGRIVEALREEREWRAAQEKAMAFWEKKKPLLVERFWQDILASRLPGSADRLELALRDFAVPFDPRRMYVQPILISIEQWTQAFTKRDEELMEYAIRNVVEETVLPGIAGCTVSDRSGVNWIILYQDRTTPLNMEELCERCKQFIHYCERHLYCKVSCYIGDPTAIEGAKGMVDALLRMEFDNIIKTQDVYLYKSMQVEPKRLSAADFSEWAEWIETGDQEALRQRIRQSLVSLQMGGGNAEALLLYYHQVLQTVYAVLQKHDSRVHDVFAESELLDPAAAPKTIRQMEEWATRVTAAASRSVKLEKDSIVRRIKDYIDAHLDERIERIELAELVHLNPAYLSRLFKKETGESLSEYIFVQKMKLTRHLLRTSGKPISEIAQIAGYSNFSYFTKAFKKMFQVSPSAYRKGSCSANGI